MNMRDLSGSKRGFTILEVVIVVVLIGVLAAIALPEYANFLERGKVTEAVNAIGSIKSAELIYKMRNDVYVSITQNTQSRLSEYLKLDIPSTGNWYYHSSTTTTPGGFTVSAFRLPSGGTLNGTYIRLTFDPATGSYAWSGNHPLRPRSE